MNVERAHSIEDLRASARRRLPRVVWQYLERGAEDDVTLRANREAFEFVHFSPRTLVDVSRREQRTELFGRSCDAPFAVAPCGAAGLLWHDADIALARAARAANVPFVLSTHSFVPLERIAWDGGEPPWFQLYLPRNRALAEKLVARALEAGCEALVLTTDVPVGGNREYNERNGFGVPLRLGPRTLLDGLSHPRWLLGTYARSCRMLGALPSVPEWGTRRDAQSWQDVAWLRRAWTRKLVLKGILCVEDARLAADAGADGIVVSNHGGRQLDGAPATLEVLPEIAAAVRGRLKVMVDGGFRRGADIVKALALGADMVLVGRAVLYGVASGGEAGAQRALQILSGEIDRVMALIGCRTLAELGPEYLRLPGRDSARVSRLAFRLRTA